MASSSLLLCLIVFVGAAVATPGVVELDTKTFDKVMNAFDAVLVKFSGDDTEDYVMEEVSESVAGDFKTLVAHVKLEMNAAAPPPRSDYDYPSYDDPSASEPEPVNTELAERFNIQKENWPQYRLFRKDLPVAEPIKFIGSDSKSKNGGDDDDDDDDDESYSPGTDTTDPEELKSFLEQNGVYLAREGCLKEMDRLAEKFFSQKDKRSDVLKSAGERAARYEDTTEAASAKIYITYMNKVVEKGDSFVEVEKERLHKILSGSMSRAKRQEVTKRSNIIQAFKTVPLDKDEL